MYLGVNLFYIPVIEWMICINAFVFLFIFTFVKSVNKGK